MLTPPWRKVVFILKHLNLDGAPLPITARAFSVSFGGEGGIRTLARFYPPNPLAGGPLWPLGYLAIKYKKL